MKSKIVFYTSEWSQKEIEKELTKAKKIDPMIEGYSFSGYLRVPDIFVQFEYVFCYKDQFVLFAEEYGYR